MLSQCFCRPNCSSEGLTFETRFCTKHFLPVTGLAACKERKRYHRLKSPLTNDACNGKPPRPLPDPKQEKPDSEAKTKQSKLLWHASDDKVKNRDEKENRLVIDSCGVRPDQKSQKACRCDVIITELTGCLVSNDARGLACRSMMRDGAAVDLPKFANSQTGIPGQGATWV
jgi:hypothetical protein